MTPAHVPIEKIRIPSSNFFSFRDVTDRSENFGGPYLGNGWGYSPGEPLGMWGIEALQIDVVGEYVAVAVLEKKLPCSLCNCPPGGRVPPPNRRCQTTRADPGQAQIKYLTDIRDGVRAPDRRKKRPNGAPALICKKTMSEVGLLVLLHILLISRARGHINRCCSTCRRKHRQQQCLLKSFAFRIHK
jgi:hypothetical protein